MMRGLMTNVKAKRAETQTVARACPYCGRKASINMSTDQDGFAVYCTNNKCRVQPTTDLDFEKLETALAWWNGEKMRKSRAK